MVRRLVWFLGMMFRLGVTLAAVSAVLLILEQYTPDDAAERALHLDDETTAHASAPDTETRNTRLRILRRSMGIDEPLFYVSLTSYAYPDTLARIPSRHERATLAHLAARCGSWEAVATYRAALAHLETRLQHDTATPFAVARAAHELQTTENTERATVLLHSINTESSPAISLEKKALNDAFTQLSSRDAVWRCYTPRVVWNGCGCQYHRRLVGLFCGNMGASVVTHEAIAPVLWRRLGVTICISGVSLLLMFALGIPFGVWLSTHSQRPLTRFTKNVLHTALLFAYALPTFAVAMLCLTFFCQASFLPLFPAFGLGDVPTDAAFGEWLRIKTAHLILPIACNTYGGFVFVTMQTRTALENVWSEPYLRTALAKGLPLRTVVWRHALPNALFPLITLFGAAFPALIAGSVVVENVFSLPGMGSYLLEAINERDYPTVFAVTMLTALLTHVGIEAAQALYGIADKRTQTFSKI